MSNTLYVYTDALYEYAAWSGTKDTFATKLAGKIKRWPDMDHVLIQRTNKPLKILLPDRRAVYRRRLTDEADWEIIK